MTTGFLFYALLSALVGYLGKNRKLGFWGNFAVAFVFTPIIGLLVVVASDRSAATTVVAPVEVPPV